MMKLVLFFITLLLGLGITYSQAKADLLKSAEKGNLEEIIKGINSGANINKRYGRFGITLLMMAAYNGHTNMVDFLLKHGAITEIKNKKSQTTALSYAAERDNLDIVKLLVEKGADIDTRDAQGWTPLMKAIAFQQTDIGKYLIEQGANLEILDNDGCSAYGYALVAQQAEIEDILLKKGAANNKKRPNYHIF